jgi:HlyD family secretion protein
MKRIVIIGSVLAILVVVVLVVVYKRHQQALAASVVPSDTYIAAADRGDLTQLVESPGQIVSNLDVAIKCRASGEIFQMPFDISDHVKKGDLILQLDKKDEQVLVDQAQATYEQALSREAEAEQAEKQAELDLQTTIEKTDADIDSAQIKADNLQKKAERQHQLLDQKLASPEDYETAESDSAQAVDDLQAAKIAKEQIESQKVALETKKEDIKLAGQQVTLDEIALKNAKQQLDYCTVNAPIDGVVADIPTTIGLGTIIASAISNIGGGTTVMTLSDLSHIFVMATVDESDIGGVDVGQKVDITADAFPGKKFEGKVVRIATQGVTASNVVTFQVKIEVTSDNKSLLKPQMTADAQIIEAQRQNVITVPIMAVVHQKHKTFVTLQNADGSTKDVEITTGINDLDSIEITSGLNGGEQLVVHKNEAANRWTSQGPGQRPLSMPGGGGGRRG